MSNTNDDRRGASRRSKVRAAITLFDGPLSPIPCVLINLSTGGARLNVMSPSDLPDAFLLTVETEQLKLKCQVVWRKGDEVGVKFVA